MAMTMPMKPKVAANPMTINSTKLIPVDLSRMVPAEARGGLSCTVLTYPCKSQDPPGDAAALMLLPLSR